MFTCMCLPVSASAEPRLASLRFASLVGRCGGLVPPFVVRGGGFASGRFWEVLSVGLCFASLRSRSCVCIGALQ